MRKIMNIFAAALVMLAAVSCEKNETLPDNNSEGKVVTLKASINNGETRTSLGAKVDDIYPVLWSAWDAISVIQGSSSYTFVLSPECAGETSGTFMYPAEQAPNFNPEENYMAFYPASSVSEVDGTVQYTISGTQSYAENSFGPGAMPMAASSTGGTTFIFNNLFGVLKLQLKGDADENDEKVTSIVVTSDKALSGEAQLVEEAIALQGEAAENKKVTLDCSADGGVALNQDEATDFHIALPAGATGLKVLINTNKGSYYKEVPNQNGEITNEIKAGKILKMPELNTKNMAPAYIENGVYYGDGIALPAGEGKTIIWAPVNCGYEPANGSYKGYPYGKLYQWGRKYGQGYKDGNYEDATYPSGDNLVTTGPVEMSAGQSTENKDKFFYKWLETPPANNLWNKGTEESPAKTEYDPCPEGWRVPTETEFFKLVNTVESNYILNISPEQLDSENNGIWFYGKTTETTGSKVFFPFAGSSEFGDEGMSNRGNTGAYWSSSYNTYEGIALFKSMAQIDKPGTYFRGYFAGYSVRCIKE